MGWQVTGKRSAEVIIDTEHFQLIQPKKQIEVECPRCKHKFEIDYDFIITNCPNCGLKKIIV